MFDDFYNNVVNYYNQLYNNPLDTVFLGEFYKNFNSLPNFYNQVCFNILSTIDNNLPILSDYVSFKKFYNIKKPLISSSKFKYFNDEFGVLLKLRKYAHINDIDSKFLNIKTGDKVIKIDMNLKCITDEHNAAKCEFYTPEEKLKKEVDKKILDTLDYYFKFHPFESKHTVLKDLYNHCNWYDPNKESDICVNLVEFQHIIMPEFFDHTEVETAATAPEITTLYLEWK